MAQSTPKTVVVDLYGGPGTGKSTLAAKTFAEFKEQGRRVELVREYVKNWAYRGEPVREFDQTYLFAKQLRAESTLYGKVDIIITDSPLGLSVVYEQKYARPGQVLVMRNLWEGVLENQANAGIYHLPVQVLRAKPYVQLGRYETEEQARRVDQDVQDIIGPLHYVTSVGDIEALLDD